MSNPVILTIAGSIRAGAFSERLRGAVGHALAAKGAQVVNLDLKALDLPLYNGDLEAAGLPPAVLDMKQMFESADGVIVVSPEYNGFFTPLLKNALDWNSRPVPGKAPHHATAGKPFGLICTSPGASGGIRALPRLRDYIGELGGVVAHGGAAIKYDAADYDAAGALIDGPAKALVERVIAGLWPLIRR